MSRANAKLRMFIHAMSIAAAIVLVISGVRQMIAYGYGGYLNSIVFTLGIVVGLIAILAALLRLVTHAKKRLGVVSLVLPRILPGLVSAVRRLASTSPHLFLRALVVALMVAPMAGQAAARTPVHSVLSPQSSVLASPPAFAGTIESTWRRTDGPVASGSVRRTWFWGPAPNTVGLMEDYRQGSGGKRLVQYFDKSRMEINNPAGDPTSPCYVTNGLLAVELISGRMQTGDSTYEPAPPAAINVAGDADDATAPPTPASWPVSNARAATTRPPTAPARP